MTPTDPANDADVASEGASPPTVRGADASSAEAADEAQKDEHATLRIVNMPRDVGWMMVSVGVLGVIGPGV